jgi:methylmalonyl-CoA mutase cobalamin-binding domain/chain
MKMPLLDQTEDLFRQIHDAVVACDEEASARLCRALLAEEIDPSEGIMKGLAAGMNTVGKLYERREYFVPELLLSSDALHAGLEILKPHIKTQSPAGRGGRILLGVVEGDVHDIGKNLVKTMFAAGGWEVQDLGVDVKLERFVEEQRKVGADIVAISALMTTSMLAIPKVIALLRENFKEIHIMVGGAPLSLEIARQYGADGYAPDAVTAVQEANRLLGKPL